jgi:class 3 adenylate cyclase
MYDAIFGFCDIRNFTDATEVLQEGVMVFVNKIGMIIHTLCDKHLGWANKNIGDAFLVVWKYPRALIKYPEKYGHLTDLIKTGMADLSFFCFLKVFAELNRSEILREYPKNALLNERIPHYKVRMGYGLHFGWAIEGAIGSPHKVDASYLSPHVNVSARLEGSTKQYGVPFLLSGDLFDLFSPELQAYARLVDVICVKGGEEAERMYTANVSDKALKFPKTDNLVQELDQSKRIYSFKRILKGSMLKGNSVGPS